MDLVLDPFAEKIAQRDTLEVRGTIRVHWHSVIIR